MDKKLNNLKIDHYCFHYTAASKEKIGFDEDVIRKQFAQWFLYEKYVYYNDVLMM